MFINPTNPNTTTNPLLNTLYSTTPQPAQLNNGKIYAGNLNTNTYEQSPLVQMKEKFKSQAQKIISNQREKEMDFLKSIEEIETEITKLEDEAKRKNDSIENIQTEKQNLMTAYGITEDSVEHKQLALLKVKIKRQSSLPQDQQESIDEMDITDYQKQALSLEENLSISMEELNDINNQIDALRNSIIDIKNEKVKSHEMADAKRAAKELLEEGSKQILKEVGKEAIDSINETLEADKKEKESSDSTNSTDDEQETESLNSTQQSSQNNQLNPSAIIDSKQIATNIKTQILATATKNHLNPDETLGIIVDTLL